MLERVPELRNIDEEILYLDEDGQICAIEPENLDSARATWKNAWCSPTNEFHDFAVGDFNADGDAEIVGIKNVGSGANEEGRLIIYDPVIHSDDVEPSGWTDAGVPWRQLALRSVDQPLITVETGNLDSNIPGDEILYITSADDSSSTVVILKADSPRPDGTGWTRHVDETFTWLWTFVATGNVDNLGSDEVVLVGERRASTGIVSSSMVAAYRVDNAELDNKEHFLEFPSTNFEWKMAQIGEIQGLVSREKEIIAINDASESTQNNIHTFHFQYDETLERLVELRSESTGEFVQPHAETIFLADISGVVNNIQDDEALFLRTIADPTDKPRLFMRGDDQDGIDIDQFDLVLDEASGWQAGVGGDLDGDAKDEIILLGDRKARVYIEPDDDLTFVELTGLVADKGQVKTGNIDARGILQASEIQAAVTGLENGLLSNQQGEFQIRIESTGQSIPFSARFLSRPSWVLDLEPASGRTPATVIVRVNTEGLQPATYSTTLEIASDTSSVRNTPHLLDLELTVLSRGLTFTPASASLIVHPCPSSPATESTELQIRSTTAISYTAFIFEQSTISAALASLEGPIHSSRINESTQLQLFDSLGNSAHLPLGQEAMQKLKSQRQQQARVPWFSSVPWLSAESDSGWTNDTLTLTVDNGSLQGDERLASSATLFIVADNSKVPAPYNTYEIPIGYLCAQSQVYHPLILQNMSDALN